MDRVTNKYLNIFTVHNRLQSYIAAIETKYKMDKGATLWGPVAKLLHRYYNSHIKELKHFPFKVGTHRLPCNTQSRAVVSRSMSEYSQNPRCKYCMVTRPQISIQTSALHLLATVSLIVPLFIVVSLIAPSRQSRSVQVRCLSLN